MKFIRLLLAIMLVPSPAVAGPLFEGMAPATFEGVTDDEGIVSFKGLPFAAPPVGERRWQPPAPWQPTSGLRVADEFGPACMQGPRTVDWYQDLIRSLGEDPNLFPPPSQGYSEDCLYLNVWTPAMGATDKMPVMVWIHGGGNEAGWSFEPDYRGHVLAREGAVVVSVPYRAGVFGWFTHPSLADETGASGNYGLLDLIAALDWIRQHIAAFGGDPDNVTIFGESAGAANIGYLMSSPAAHGLFHRAIHQSGGFQLSSTPDIDDLNNKGARFAASLDTDLDGLKTMPATELLAAAEALLGDWPWSPVAGGHALPKSPGEVFAAGEQSPVPLMIGTNHNEWLMYLAENETVAEAIETLGLEKSKKRIERRLGKLPDDWQRDRLYTAQLMRCPSYAMASAMAEVDAPAFVYHLNRVREGDHWQAVGAYHGAEIPYVFGTHADWLSTNAADHALTDIIQGYWVNFARSGNPNGDGLPGWKPWLPNRRRVVDLDDDVSMMPAPDRWLCEALNRRAPAP